MTEKKNRTVKKTLSMPITFQVHVHTTSWQKSPRVVGSSVLILDRVIVHSPRRKTLEQTSSGRLVVQQMKVHQMKGRLSSSSSSLSNVVTSVVRPLNNPGAKTFDALSAVRVRKRYRRVRLRVVGPRRRALGQPWSRALDGDLACQMNL